VTSTPCMFIHNGAFFHVPKDWEVSFGVVGDVFFFILLKKHGLRRIIGYS